jgi:hypothetical protein
MESNNTLRTRIIVVASSVGLVVGLSLLSRGPFGQAPVGRADPPTDTPTPTPTHGPTSTPAPSGTARPTISSGSVPSLSETMLPPTMVTPVQTPVLTPTP